MKQNKTCLVGYILTSVVFHWLTAKSLPFLLEISGTIGPDGWAAQNSAVSHTSLLLIVASMAKPTGIQLQLITTNMDNTSEV